MSKDGGIPFLSEQIAGLKTRRRIHVCMPAWWTRRPKLGEVPSTYRHETEWQALTAPARLWVQEEMRFVIDGYNRAADKGHYCADLVGNHPPIPGGYKRGRWRVERVNAWNMDREFSRWVLDVTEVRRFFLHDIGFDTIRKEGSLLYPTDTPGQWWNRHHGFVTPWDTNPELIGITFEAVYANIDGRELPPLGGKANAVVQKWTEETR